MTSMRKAYSYIRMSTEVQLKGDSLRRQLEASTEYAKLNDLELVDSIDGTKLHDLGVSAHRGKNASQGTLSLFLDYIEKGLIEPNSVLLVESLDRLSRNKIGDALTLFMGIINQGIEIITFADNQKYNKESINKNPAALFISLGIMFRANEESEIKSIRAKSKWDDKRRQASEKKKPLTKALPSWLKMNDDGSVIIVDEAKAKVVRQIFNLCSTTTGIYGITKFLNESKVPTFNNTKYWHQSYVNKILNNRSVIGEFQPYVNANGVEDKKREESTESAESGKRKKSGKPIENYFPAIISIEEFNSAQLAISQRKTNVGRKGSTFTNLLSGLVYCKCGQKMTLMNKGNTKNNKILTCGEKLANAGCKNDNWVMGDAVELLFKHLKEIDFNNMLNVENKELKLSNLIAALEEENRELSEKEDSQLELYNDPLLNVNAKEKVVKKLNDINEKQTINKEQIKQLNAELEEHIVSKQSFNNKNIQTIIERLNTDDYMFRASINTTLSKFIERIELRPAPAFFAPYEFTDTDKEVIEYKKTHPNLTLDQIVNRESFKRLYKKMNRTMIVKYKFGTTRMIQGDGLTYYNNVEQRLAEDRVK